MPRPFVRVPFAALPARPEAHPFFSGPEDRIDVVLPDGGRSTVSLRRFGAGPPLLLLHGLMTTGYSWRRVIRDLSARFTVLVPDLPGAGRTVGPEGPLPPARVADWMVALLDALQLDRAAVIGNSMGGYLALWLALRAPTRVDRLLVVHAPGLPEPRLHALRIALRLPGAIALLRWMVQRDPQRWVWRNVHYWDEAQKSREELEEYGAPLATAAGFDGFARQLRDMMDPLEMQRFVAAWASPPPGLPPVHLLYTRRDPMVPPALGPRLQRVVPGATLTIVDEGGHFLHVDRPAAFLAAVDGWAPRG